MKKMVLALVLALALSACGAAEESGLAYTGEVNGESVNLMDYICTDEGGAWYYESNPATLLNAQGK